jgi:hypothetical protein
MQRVEGQLKALLRSVDTGLLELSEKKAVASIRRLATDTRLDIRDYELSETRDEQVRCAKAAQKRIDKLEKTILAISPIFSAADVAHLTAMLDHIHSRLV